MTPFSGLPIINHHFQTALSPTNFPLFLFSTDLRKKHDPKIYWNPAVSVWKRFHFSWLFWGIKLQLQAPQQKINTLDLSLRCKPVATMKMTLRYTRDSRWGVKDSFTGIGLEYLGFTESIPFRSMKLQLVEPLVTWKTDHTLKVALAPGVNTWAILCDGLHRRICTTGGVPHPYTTWSKIKRTLKSIQNSH